jgi:hypothetical protein
MPVRSRLSEQAIAYFLFAALQQFYFDENKRTARCQINGYLMSHGFDAIRVIPLSFAQRRRCGNAVVRCASLWQRRRQVRPAASPPSLSSPASTTIPRSQITWRARRAIQAAGPSGRPDPPGQTVPDAALDRSQSAVWDQFGDVVVELGQCLVECGEPGPMCSRELGEVGVGYLAVADDSLGWHVGVRDIVSPEFVPRVGGGVVEDRACRGGRLAFADEQPHQATLGDRAGGEAPGHAYEPGLGGLMMDMIID